jgi:peroxiredoxin
MGHVTLKTMTLGACLAMYACGSSNNTNTENNTPQQNPGETPPETGTTTNNNETPPPQTPDSKPDSTAPQFSLSGEFSSLDGQTVNLKDDQGKPTVIFFAQDSCLICSNETKHLISGLANPQEAPANINLYTVLVGAFQEDAQAWFAGHNPPWKVGFDPDLELFFEYFKPGSQTPSVLVFDPKAGIVLSKSGVVARSEIESLTGAWE